jgi:hypothetical protein
MTAPSNDRAVAAGHTPGPWKGETPTEQAVYDHYMAGSTRGDLYAYVKRGREGVMKPDRSFGHAYAAWMAGQHLSKARAGGDL